ncbi:hypothetical protein E0Z10_g3740 [Xylaria hypoxylon]|uniref:Heterokaryon incompatibility domain-containing protein n=1 Tax=Xylaria hypoxylon TaxID=37992 RepID=A0A4Z0YYJ6_9PEZI|nr:hypothetical protein E0Z10_g3740 [Xylaria hypoxylon]
MRNATVSNLNAGVPERTEPLAICDNVPSFTHSPPARPESMIRLLKITRCAPAYRALSYCWGPPPDNIKFLCNGSVFYDRASLRRALKRLRAGFRPGQREEYIWADAICINQQDLAGKDYQIRLMERIYWVIATVHVDLGDMKGHEVSVDGFTLRFSGLGGMGVEDTLTEPDQPGHPLHYKTVFQALAQPWFTRTWTIQDVALADIILSKESMLANPSHQQELMRSNATIRGYMNYQKLQRIKNHSGKMDSLQPIQLTRDFDVTNPEDKIFGLFALLCDADRKAIGPYSRSIEHVFRRFAAFQVRLSRTITALDSAGLQRRCRPRGNKPPFQVFHNKFRAAFDGSFANAGSCMYINNEEAFARLLLMGDMYTGRNDPTW